MTEQSFMIEKKKEESVVVKDDNALFESSGLITETSRFVDNYWPQRSNR